ncbi:regulator of chromosome condensation 1/beta-lactamase-inhibitor protein II [Mycena galericulata]|nr:regulator of chromosome condensation 1/beta-lactamase-inhibitor protein II [Mycena galericulata]
MLKASRSWRTHVRQLQTTANPRTRLTRPGLLASSALLASALWYSHHVYNDSPVSFTSEKKQTVAFLGGQPSDQNESSTLSTLVWGSNRANLLSPLLPSSVTIKKPFAAEWLNNVALRDLALSDTHAACVDARGDVYQWGAGYAPRTLGDESPTRTLIGKDIIKLQLSDRRVYALSKTGKVYVSDASASKQAFKGPPAVWWKFWASSQLINFAELTPENTLGWGEKFISISAGRDHLLGLTSTGRTFSCPINKNANTCGQLGFHLPDLPSSVPKSIASPSYAAATVLSSPDDDADNIWFCTTMYEIPVLKGVDIAQVAAGTRSSFARTSSGKVLAWGANEHGQLGLGTKFPSDVITIPTEVVLWPTKSQESSTRCLDVSAGGDLTGFTIERVPTNSDATVVEVLMCGDGQWGGLGNNLYSNAQVNPTRVKALSGLVEYNGETERLQCIKPRSISISRTGHVLATLASSGNHDLLVWGRNQDHELGNGKKTNVPSPMPVDVGDGRLLLQRKKATEVRDLQRRVYGRSVPVEQFAISGFGSSIIYWRLLS